MGKRQSYPPLAGVARSAGGGHTAITKALPIAHFLLPFPPMRAIIQRVSQASVTINNTVSGSIDTGLLVLLGIEDADTRSDLEWLANKIIQLRIFNDTTGVMNLSLNDVNGDFLLVSQFTLFASTKKGNRPSYIRASKPPVAIPLYEEMKSYLETQLQRPIQSGIFGADMKVALINDGPVTIFIDSRARE